jgi:NAD(P)-dependent dehydrogenase (short-subunit alcohol dehydrogenase family)
LLADLTGKTAIITGGGQGLGFGISTKMAQQGANIIVTDIDGRNKSVVNKLAETNNVKSLYLEMDVTDQEQVNESIKKALNFSDVNILVNNAGVSGAPGSTGTIWRDEDWDFTWKINVKGLHTVTEALLPHMIEKQSGKIINISSVAAKAAKYTTAYYATTKMAVIAYTQALAREFGPKNINVNAIAPGRILTEFHKEWVENRKNLGDTTTDLFSDEALKLVMPLGRAQSPEDIGALATFLASEDARNITGQTIQCDGGQVMA